MKAVGVVAVCVMVLAAIPSVRSETVIAHWPFAGGSLEDTSGHNYTLTNGSAVTTSDGFLHFPSGAAEGTSWAQTTNKVSMSGSKYATVTLWLRNPNSTGSTSLMELTDMSAAENKRTGSFLLGYTADRKATVTYYVPYSGYKNTRSSTAGLFDDGEWHQITVTMHIGGKYENPPVNLYVDGMLDSKADANARTTNATGGDTFKNDTFYFARRKGSAGSGGSFAGDLDEIVIYSDVMPATNVLRNYVRELGRLYNGDSSKYQSRLPDGWRVDAAGVISYRVTITNVSDTAVLSLDGGETAFVSTNAWLAEGTSFTVTVTDATGRHAAWFDAPAGVSYGARGLSASYGSVGEPLVLRTATFDATHVWSGGTDGDWFAAANWTDAAGAVQTAAPGTASVVFVPAASAAAVTNNVTVTNAFSVKGLYVGAGAGEAGAVKVTFKHVKENLVTDDVLVSLHGILTTPFQPSTVKTFATETDGYKVIVKAGGRMTIAKDGWIDLCGKGFGKNVPSGYCSGGRNSSTGASHGGRTLYTLAYGWTGGKWVYDSVYYPTNFGAGGGQNSALYNGGGSTWLKAGGTFTLDGTIDVNADTRVNESSGSGGSVVIECGALVGSGTITASAVRTPHYYCGGGAGRVAVHQSAATDFSGFTGKVSCRVGTSGSRWAGAGTCYRRSAGQSLAQGDLIVDNEGVNCGFWQVTEVTEEAAAFGTVTVRGGARFHQRPGQDIAIGRWLDTTGGAYSNANAVTDFSRSADFTLRGTNLFNTLVYTNAGGVMRFGAGTENRTVILENGGLTFGGTAEHPARFLPEPSDGTWYLEVGPTPAYDITHVAVSNSNARGGTAVLAIDSLNLGGNDNWGFSSAILPGDPMTWTGAADGKWGNVENWEDKNGGHRAPVATDAVTIPVTLTKGAKAWPVISEGTVSVGKLLVKGKLTLNGGNVVCADELDVTGTVAAMGLERIVCSNTVTLAENVFTGPLSTVTLTGTNAQAVAVNGNAFGTFEVVKAGGAVTFAHGFSAETFKVEAYGALSLTFAEGRTVTCTNFFAEGTVDGVASLALVSDASSPWYLNVSAVAYAGGVGVTNCDARAGIEIPADVSSSGENALNWSFGKKMALWTGAVNSKVSEAGNWRPTGVPSDGAQVVVASAEAMTFTVDLAVNWDKLVLNAGHGKITATSSKAMQLGALVFQPGEYAVDLTLGGALSVGSDLDLPRGTTVFAERQPISVDGDLTIRSGAKIKCATNSGTGPSVDVTATGDATLEAGAEINVVGMGYDVGKGPAGDANGRNAKTPAGHGGSWIPTDTTVARKAAYGAIFAPVTCGSSCTYKGGGAVKLTVEGTFALDGTINANGDLTGTECSGAGGSVWVTCGKLTGAGTVSADGGSSTSYNNGGGGRVALVQTAAKTFADWTGTAHALNPGGCSKSAGSGTVYMKSAGSDADVYVWCGQNRPASVTDFPMEADGDPKKCYRTTAFHVTTNATLYVTGDVTIRDLDLPTPNSKIMLNGHTVTVLESTHRNGRRWGASYADLVIPGGTEENPGRIVWRGGTTLIIR